MESREIAGVPRGAVAVVVVGLLACIAAALLTVIYVMATCGAVGILLQGLGAV